MLRKLQIVVAGACLLAAFSFSAHSYAAASTSAVSVSAAISNVCAFGGSTPTTVSFAGGYDPVVANAATAATAAYSPQYACTKSDAVYTWSFSSANRAGTQAALKSGSNALNYNISDAASNAYNADGSNAFSVGSAGNGSNTLTYSSFTFTIPAGQNVPPGTYTDTLTVTLTP